MLCRPVFRSFFSTARETESHVGFTQEIRRVLLGDDRWLFIHKPGGGGTNRPKGGRSGTWGGDPGDGGAPGAGKQVVSSLRDAAHVQSEVQREESG